MTSGNLVPFPSGRKTLVLDSWPVMEWLKGRQPTTTTFRRMIEDAGDNRLRLVMSTINLGEIYYQCIFLWKLNRADELLSELRALPIEFFHPNEEDALRAARIKGLYQGAYGDAFAAVLATECIAAVLTGDPDFLKLQTAGVLMVEWIGR